MLIITSTIRMKKIVNFPLHLPFFFTRNASASYLGTIPSENEEIYFLSAGGKSTEVYWQWGLSVNPQPSGRKKNFS